MTLEYKGLLVERDNKIESMFRIKYPGSGSIPVRLEGSFTSAQEAQKAIDKEEDRKEKVKEERKNAKSKTDAKDDKLLQGESVGSESSGVPA